jgi:hypothetical protein
VNQGYQDETRAPLTRAQIRVVLPTLAHVTKRAARFVADRLERLTRWESPEDLAAIDAHVQDWFDSVRRLGGVPRGMWLVEFPGRAGWFGWQEGDADITLYRPHGAPPEERGPLH